MNPELAYLLKINVGIVLFYAFYRFFFYKDTFFHWRRTALLGFLVISLFYPLLNIQDWVKEQEPMVVISDLYATVVLPDTSIEVATISRQENALTLLGYTYWSGVVLLSIRFLAQLISIFRLRIRCKITKKQNIHIRVLEKDNGPFSFFHWIFIHPESLSENELSEILTHELTHVRQYHSVDVLFSELMCIACWFNPFIWLMKREVRNNLEYMADNRVIQTGHDYKTYQYHLLGLAHQKAAATLSNSFNVLPLKNRIKMMNKKRTKEIGRTKYLLFLPLAALLMIISNIEAVARTTQLFAKEMIQTATEQTTPNLLAEANVIDEATPSMSATDQNKEKAVDKEGKPIKSVAIQASDDDDPNTVVFEVVDEMPSYPGGMAAMKEYIRKNFKYPAKIHEQEIQGRVIVQFIVEKDGTLSNMKVLRSLDPILDTEALRVLSGMPKWNPGKQKGQTVRVKYAVPVPFSFIDTKTEEIKESNLSEVVVVAYEPEEEVKKDEPVFSVVDEMPKYPGGLSALMSYLGRNIKYPTASQQRKEEGRVIVEMIINADGRVVNPQIARSVSPLLDAEAIRVVSSMPKWEPGKQGGKIVSVKYNLPVTFKLISNAKK